jgi:saccharopine dehydrogenase (NAD+, L-lysine-forming)
VRLSCVCGRQSFWDSSVKPISKSIKTKGGKEMKILVLGGAGIVGKAITKDLLEQPDVSKVVIGDIGVERAEKYLSTLGSSKGFVEKIDVNDYNHLVKKMKGFDVIANCVYYGMVIPITKAAIEAKVHYSDLGGFVTGTQAQSEMDEEIQKAGITVLHGCGSGPGITNILARYGADKLDRVDEIHIRAGATAPSAGSPEVKGAGMTIQTVLDEFTMPPVIWDNGEYRELPPISGREVVEFPEPLGEQVCYFSRHSEPWTLGKYIGKGLKHANIKVVFPQEELDKLTPFIESGLTSREPIDFKGRNIVPREFLDHLLVARELLEEEQGSEFCGTLQWVTGMKDNEPVKITHSFMVEHEKRWGNTKTGVCFSVGILMIGRGQITKRGFTVPEEAIDPVKFIEEVKKRGFIFTEKEERFRNL